MKKRNDNGQIIFSAKISMLRMFVIEKYCLQGAAKVKENQTTSWEKQIKRKTTVANTTLSRVEIDFINNNNYTINTIVCAVISNSSIIKQLTSMKSY